MGSSVRFSALFSVGMQPSLSTESLIGRSLGLLKTEIHLYHCLQVKNKATIGQLNRITRVGISRWSQFKLKVLPHKHIHSSRLLRNTEITHLAIQALTPTKHISVLPKALPIRYKMNQSHNLSPLPGPGQPTDQIVFPLHPAITRTFVAAASLFVQGKALTPS